MSGGAASARGTATRIMGVLNVTPDSFSDGGAYAELETAVARGRELAGQGAHIVDVGGESTRPGAERVSAEEEQRRVLPVVEALAAEGIRVSIDTVRAETARLAVAAGASIVNDVSGGTADPQMLRVAAECGSELVLMHWRGIPDPSHSRSRYVDVVAEVHDELAALADAAIAAGVAPERIILDPGLGFDKTAAQGWQLLAGIGRLADLGHPLLIGASRKRMLAETLTAAGARDGIVDRDLATAVVSALSARAGAWGVRVHDVPATVAALAVAEAWGAPASSPDPAPLLPQLGSRRDLTGSEVASTAELRAEGDAKPALAPEPDRIALTGLEVFAHHGVFGFEREQGQRFVIDAEVAVDMRDAAARDELARTVNYAELTAAILAAAADEPVDLIETLAERLAGVALRFAGVTEARITVHKPDAPIDAQFADVSVRVVRRREPHS